MNAPRTRRRFTQEFKDDAVSLVIDQGYKSAEVARRLGVCENNVNRWVRQYREHNEKESPDGLSRDQLEAELKRLRKENKRLEMEREILKKAAAFFADPEGGAQVLLVRGMLYAVQPPMGNSPRPPLRIASPGATVWMSDPTWANHNTIFEAAGLTRKKYAYRDPDTNGLDFAAMCASIKTIPKGDIILLHGCCHNPTGIDPTPEQWAELGELLAAQGVLPLVDPAPGHPDTARTVAAGDRIWSTEPVVPALLGKVIVLDPAGGGSDPEPRSARRAMPSPAL